MRLTTKIITGFFLSIFILSLLHIIGYSFSDRKLNTSFPDYSIKIPQTNPRGIDIASYRVFVFESLQTDFHEQYRLAIAKEGSSLFIQPATTENDDNKLLIPDALYDFLSTQAQNDTLTVKINLDEICEKYGTIDTIDEAVLKLKKGIKIGIPISGLNLYLHTSNANINIINYLSNIQTRINKMEMDSIIIYSSTGDITIDSCKVKVIEPSNNRKLTVTNSTAQIINLDLDHLNNWNIKDCDIEMRNYTGSGQKNIRIDGNERGKINWRPKDENAELNIKLKVDSAQIVFQNY